MSNYTCARCGAHPIHLIEPCERHGDQGASSMTTDHPTTEAHTCHDHCPCQPGTEAEYLGWPSSHDADCKCGFVPAHAPRKPPSDLARNSMEAFREQNFPAPDESDFRGFDDDKPSPSDLARDDDAQSEPLRDRAIRALAACDARWNDDTGDWDIPAPEYLAQMADAALSVVRPELDRRDDLAAELRRQVQSRTKAMDELFRTREKARKEASEARSELAKERGDKQAWHRQAADKGEEIERLRSELADLTSSPPTDGDFSTGQVRSVGSRFTDPAKAWRSPRAATASPAADTTAWLSPSVDSVSSGSDNLRRRAEAAEAEREASDVHADRLLDERDKWRREYSKERAQSRHFEAQRDALIEASLATDYTKDHECGTAVDDPDAYEVAQANITEMHRVLLVRLERLFQANDARDDEFRRAETAKADRDRALWQRDEATSERDDMQSGWARETHERDTAQDEVKELREERDAAVANADRLTESLRNELNRNSELRGDRDGWKYLCQTNTDNLNGDIKKLTAERDALQARIDAVLVLCDRYDAADPYTPVADIKVPITDIRRALIGTAPPADDGSEATPSDLQVSPSLGVGDGWQPRIGEPVIRLGGAHEFPATVVEQRPDGTYLTHDQADGAEAVVTVDKLRPGMGSEQ